MHLPAFGLNLRLVGNAILDFCSKLLQQYTKVQRKFGAVQIAGFDATFLLQAKRMRAPLETYL